MSGVGRFLKDKDPKIKVVLLDPIGSIYYHYFYYGVIDPDQIGSYYVEGVGEDHLAKCMDFSFIDDVRQFNDANAFKMCPVLAEKEGLLCGGTSGANVWGSVELARTLRGPATIVTVLPDGGANYVSKIYNETWLAEHGFEAMH